MKIERFNELLNGPLSHPIPMFIITRLSRALLFVVEMTGDAGEEALERFCRDQQSHDEQEGG